MAQPMASSSLWYSTIFCSLLIYLLFYYLGQRQFKRNKVISKYLRTYPVVGTLPDFLKNRNRFLEWMTDVLGEQPTNTITFRRPGKVQGVITANPMNVEYMLKTNFENYPKGERINSLLEDFLGDGIFNSDGEMWKVSLVASSCHVTLLLCLFLLFFLFFRASKLKKLKITKTWRKLRHNK